MTKDESKLRSPEKKRYDARRPEIDAVAEPVDGSKVRPGYKVDEATGQVKEG